MSGMTLVFVPPWTTVGAKVVWVQAWNWRAMPTRQRVEGADERSLVEQRRGELVG